MSTANRATELRYSFGEGLRFDADTRMLTWVDLLAGRLHRAPVDEPDAVELLVELPEPLGAYAPCADGGWLLATGRGLAHLGGDGAVRQLVQLEPDGNRMNDAACDDQGRFWAGTMAYDESAGAGSLHRVGLDGQVEQVLGGVTVGNGPAFSPDRRTLYLDDSGRAVTLAYDLADDGTLSGERVLVEHDRGAGDGLTVDDDGHLWVALFGGSGVRRYDPAGRLVEQVEVPASQVSSCVVAEGRLFCTTVAQGVDEPGAGHLYVVDVGVMAPSVRPYRGVLPGQHQG